MFTLMDEPVILPSSRITMDKATIRSHLLSDPNDPFNRSPLEIEDVIPGKLSLDTNSSFTNPLCKANLPTRRYGDESQNRSFQEREEIRCSGSYHWAYKRWNGYFSWLRTYLELAISWEKSWFVFIPCSSCSAFSVVYEACPRLCICFIGNGQKKWCWWKDKMVHMD